MRHRASRSTLRRHIGDKPFSVALSSCFSGLFRLRRSNPSLDASPNRESPGRLLLWLHFQRARMNSTYFGLLAEFGEANISLDEIAGKYFGLSPQEAKRRAAAKRLPCPAFRLGGQKSPWLVSAADLATLIDKARELAAS
jgi:Pyocin activator protein PrtN